MLWLSACASTSAVLPPKPGGGFSLTVVNRSLTTIVVQAWHGSNEMAVDCEVSVVFHAIQGPRLPWHVHVTAVGSSKTIYDGSVSGTGPLALVVRSGSAQIRPATGSYGPVSTCSAS